MSYKSAGILIVRDICGILRKQISNDLIDGVVALFLQCVIYGAEDGADLFVLAARQMKFSGQIQIHNERTSKTKIIFILPYFFQAVKRKREKTQRKNFPKIAGSLPQKGQRQAPIHFPM
jgi:hypothetical protein